jgi:hypothetical protein
MHFNLRCFSAIVLFAALGSMAIASRPVQGQQAPSVQGIPNETMFSSMLRVAESYSASLDDSFLGHGPGGGIDFFRCGRGPKDFMADDDPYYDVTELAFFIAVLSRHLKAEGTYPVAEPFLNRLIKYGEVEATRINAKAVHNGSWKDDNIALLENLAYVLNKTLHRQRYVVEGGCGAGEIRTLVKIPAGSAAVLINTFHFMLCQARGMDPWNAQVCYGWKAVGKVPMLMAGAYRYVITMTNGSKKIGDVLVAQKAQQSLSSFGSDDAPYLLNLQ